MSKQLAKIHAPDAEHVLAARKASGHTQRQAAETIYVDERTWQRWEAGATGMAPAFWELYLLKIGACHLPGD